MSTSTSPEAELPRSLPNRREAIRMGLAAAGAAALAGVSTARAEAKVSRVARIAHCTDFHIMPERNAEQGVRTMWRALAAEPDAPSLVITGGDHIMHSMDQLKSRVESLWELWHRVKRQECRFDTFPVIGNHDCWGWHPASEAAEGDPRRGKAWALEGLELNQRFYSITGRVPGWRIIVLDGVQPHPERMYQGRLDEEQFEWLRGELASARADEHVLIATHIPILSVGVTLNSRVFVQGARKTEIDARDMHTDASRVLALLDEFPQVRGVISGHLHQTDRVEYAGPRAAAEGRPPIVHLCNGAASGAWWRGTNINAPQAYALLDLHADGRIERTIRPFPHTVRDPDDMPPRRSP